jgi:hypothetical protein
MITLDSFDWRFYLSKYKELQSTGINSKKKAYNHWLTIGQFEGKTDKNIIETNITKVFLLTNTDNDNIAIYIKSILEEHYNSDIKILYNADDKLFRKSSLTDLYIIINFNLDNYIYYPKKYIIYQTSKHRITNIQILEKSYFTWEYSIKNHLTYSTIPLEKIFYMPLPFDLHKIIDCKLYEECLYDIFIDGEISEKTLPIIKKTKENYKVKVSFNGLEDIVNSKIIVNLNLYEDSSFNTDKINKLLNYNNIIISEKPCKADIYSIEIYKDTIIFIDDINQLDDTIQYYLNTDNYNRRIKYLKETKILLYKKIKYIFQKNISLISNLVEKESYRINHLQKYIYVENNSSIDSTAQTHETDEEDISLENFDWRLYVSKCKELQITGLNSRKKAYTHWIINRKSDDTKENFSK